MRVYVEQRHLWLFSFSPLPFLPPLHVYPLFLSFVISYFHSDSIPSVAISFRTFLLIRIVDERLKLLTIMDFVRHSFFNPKALSRSFVSSFVRLFPSFFIGSMELGECQGVERDRPRFMKFFSGHVGIVQRLGLRKC